MPRDAVYRLDILDSARLIGAYVAGKTRADFLREVGLQDQVIRRFEIIGEAARRLSEAARAELPTVPWPRLIAFRNVLIHQYDEINLELVWQVIERDLPGLVAALEPLVPPEQP